METPYKAFFLITDLLEYSLCLLTPSSNSIQSFATGAMKNRYQPHLSGTEGINLMVTICELELIDIDMVINVKKSACIIYIYNSGYRFQRKNTEKKGTACQALGLAVTLSADMGALYGRPWSNGVFGWVGHNAIDLSNNWLIYITFLSLCGFSNVRSGSRQNVAAYTS